MSLLSAARLVAASLLVLLCAAGREVGAVEDAPRAAVAEPVAELGRVAPGDTVVREFSIANEGKAPLRLAEVRASRGLRIEGYDAAIAPGGSGRIRVAVDTWSFIGSPRLSVTAVTNDPERSRIELALKVEVHPFVVARPGHARYLTYQGAPEGTIAQTLADAGGADFRVVGVESPYPHLRVTFHEARPEERDPALPGRQWRIEATLASESPVGALADFIRVHLDHPRQREMRIPVSGFVRPMLAVTPPAASLGDVDLASSPSWVLIIKNYADDEVDLSDARADVRGFAAVVEPIQRGRSYRLRLSVGRDVQPGPFSGAIRIRTSSAKRPWLDVPLTGRIVASPPATRPAAPPGG